MRFFPVFALHVQRIITLFSIIQHAYKLSCISHLLVMNARQIPTEIFSVSSAFLMTFYKPL